MTLELINPEGLSSPLSYTHVVAATGSRLVFVAGQVAGDADGNLVGDDDLAAQALLPVISEARIAVFGDHKPADVIVGVETLAESGYRIEVEALAVVD